MPQRPGRAVGGTATVLAKERVLWVQRAIQLYDEKGKPFIVYGLFACYRSDSPAHPDCYVVKHRAGKQDLDWPGRYLPELSAPAGSTPVPAAPNEVIMPAPPGGSR